MTSRRQWIRHRFAGGWAPDLGPSSDAVPGADGDLNLPFLVNAENMVFELDGGPRKAPGTAKLSTELESGATVKGIFDAWFSGSGGSSTQHRVIHVGTTIKRDDADGTFTNLFTGLTSGAVPSHAMLEDLLVIASDASGDVPRSWDGTTAQNLAGTPENFSVVRTHQNRMWALGVPDQPSRLYYSALLDPADWVGAGSGTIDIDPDDGDRLTGMVSHKNELIVFKGPYKGSIHRITGSAPTGDDAFARKILEGSVGAIGQNTIFRFRDDIGFVALDGTIRSLATTAEFGDFIEGALSREINSQFIATRVNTGRLKHAYAVNVPTFGFVLIALPVDAATKNNYGLIMDYRFNPVRWAVWLFTDGLIESIAEVVDSANNDRRIIMAGGNDGFVRKLLQTDRTIDGASAINYRVTFPHLTYGTAIVRKTVAEGALGLAPKNSGSLTFGYTLDAMAQKTKSISQVTGDVLGVAAANQFTLNTSVLGGTQFIEKFFNITDGGDFRSIQFEVSNSGNYEDVELHTLAVAIEGGAWSTENA